MNAVKNVMLASTFVLAGLGMVAGCRKVPDVIKEIPTESVDTTLTTEQYLDSIAKLSRANVEIAGKIDKQLTEEYKKSKETEQNSK
ncbi:hypothetical protein IKQ21_03925 [bacterium]|nr:hypothetical protein [bacterium]